MQAAGNLHVVLVGSEDCDVVALVQDLEGEKLLLGQGVDHHFYFSTPKTYAYTPSGQSVRRFYLLRQM